MSEITAEKRRDRVHLRLDAATKHKLERAASYSRESLSEFVLSNAVEAADRVIESHEMTTLPKSDWDVFFAALEKPPKPNTKLKSGFDWYRKTFS